MLIENAIHSQKVYDPTDDSIMAEQELCMERLYDYDHTRPSEHAKRAQLLKEMLAECGAGCWIEPPFHANWGGKHVHMGDYVYANFGLTCVDDTHIYIGEHTIRIGRNCWLGAGVIVVPGVTIGDNTVIGAGSVVTKDIPANVVAVGNPCHVLRPISEHDKEYFYQDRKINWET